MDKDCLVSVIIPVHNTADYLRKCVDSVRNQTLKGIEIILVENLSVDNSAAICDEYARMDPRIKVLHLSVAGLSIARNRGITCASAPYIGFVDSDDYIAPTMYQDLLDALLDNQADLVYCNYFYERVDHSLDSTDANSGNSMVKPRIDFLREMMFEKISCSACTKLFKKEFFEKVCFPENKFYEDRWVMHDWIMLCDKIVWVDKPLYYYVERLTGICHTMNPINRYHFFLSEYARLEFVEKSGLFAGQELYQLRTFILNICFSIFKEIMMIVKPKEFREPILDMRHKIKALLYMKKEEVDNRCYKRIRKISYCWPAYYFIRFFLKKMFRQSLT